MNKTNRFIIKLLSSFFFLGYFPYFPGTFASFVSLIFIWFLRQNPFLYLFTTVVIIIIGFLITAEAEVIFKEKDPAYVVIDEVGGMFLSLLFVPIEMKTLFFGFFIFRVLDGLKAYPACYFENFPKAKGIMLDDLVAGLYTNIVLQFIFRLLV
jgi:phosphatidylglycerophosphatase A